MRRAFVFQLYRTKRVRHLHARIDLAAEIHNHLIAVQKRYYRRFHGYIGYYRLKRHVTRLKQWGRFAHWRTLDAQAMQHIVWRIDQGYQLFFQAVKARKAGLPAPKVRPPTFKKRQRYKSITLAQTGWKYDGGNCIWLFGRAYRFHQSREIAGTIKTVTIKRLPTGRMEVMFSCLCEEETMIRCKTGQTAAFDFGLTHFLTGHNGHDIHAPQPFRSSLRQVRKANRALSRKQLGSGHRRQARHTLSMVHRRIAHQRSAWHWDTAHALCQRYDTIYLEDLELRGMSAMWGRKVADLGFGHFVQVLHQAAVKHGTHVHHVDRWFPSTKRCHKCWYVNHALTLRDRTWTCPGCQTFHHRDRNASHNLHQEGASSCERGGCKTRFRAATV